MKNNNNNSFFYETLLRIKEVLVDFYWKVAIFAINKMALYRKKWELRKSAKILKKMGGELIIKNNEYLGGTTVSVKINLPQNLILKKEESKKNSQSLKKNRD